MTEMNMFNGKTAIITGSSSGIGKATALRFCELGCNVVVTGRNVEALNETVKECREKSANSKNIISVIGEISDESVRQSLIDEALKHFGQIDFLINNAGLSARTMAVDHSGTMEKFQRVFDVNVKSAVDLSQKCIPHLIKTKGNIVNVSSVLATKPLFPFTYYCMSKAALDMYTKCLAQEVGPHGVRVNSINPGSVKTNISRTSGNVITDEELDARYERSKEHSPLGIYAEPIDIAHAIVFLASEQSKFITGECLYSDGGVQLGKVPTNM